MEAKYYKTLLVFVLVCGWVYGSLMLLWPSMYGKPYRSADPRRDTLIANEDHPANIEWHPHLALDSTIEPLASNRNDPNRHIWNISPTFPSLWDTSWSDASRDVSLHFVEPGRYIVSMLAYGCGNDTSSIQICVESEVSGFYNAPELSTLESTPIPPPLDTVPGTVWVWTFPDSSDFSDTTSLQPASYSYSSWDSSSGSRDVILYTVTLMASNMCGSESSYDAITVLPADTSPKFRRSRPSFADSTLITPASMRTTNSAEMAPVSAMDGAVLDRVNDLQDRLDVALQRIEELSAKQPAPKSKLVKPKAVSPSLNERDRLVYIEIGRLQGEIEALRRKDDDSMTKKDAVAMGLPVHATMQDSTLVVEHEGDVDQEPTEEKGTFGFTQLIISVLTGALVAAFTDGGKAMFRKLKPLAAMWYERIKKSPKK